MLRGRAAVERCGAAQHPRSTNINGPRGTSCAAVGLRPMRIAGSSHADVLHVASPTNVFSAARETRRSETANIDKPPLAEAELRSTDGPSDTAPHGAARAIDEHRRPPWDIERRGRTAADDERGGARTQTSCDGPSDAAQHMRSPTINGPWDIEGRGRAARGTSRRRRTDQRRHAKHDELRPRTGAQPIDVTRSSAAMAVTLRPSMYARTARSNPG